MVNELLTKIVNFYPTWAGLTLTLIRRGGGRISKAYSSETKIPIDFKPSCKFEFVPCLKVYVIKIDQFGPWRVSGGFFFIKGPRKSALQSPFRIHWDVHEGLGLSLEPW